VEKSTKNLYSVTVLNNLEAKVRLLIDVVSSMAGMNYLI